MPVPSEIFVRRGSQNTRAFQWLNETMQPRPVHFILTRRLSCWHCGSRSLDIKRKAVTQRNDGLLERRSTDQRSLHRVVSVELLNNYVRQGCEREGGKQKHNRAKHRVWIFGRHADSAIRLSGRGGCEGVFIQTLASRQRGVCTR